MLFRSPLGSTLVVTEMAGLQLLPPVLIASLLALFLTSEVSLIHSQQEREGAFGTSSRPDRRPNSSLEDRRSELPPEDGAAAPPRSDDTVAPSRSEATAASPRTDGTAAPHARTVRPDSGRQQDPDRRSRD